MSDAGQRDTLEVLRACAAGLAGLESKDIKNRQLKEKVTPIIEHYKNLGVLYEIDGNKPKEDVTKQIESIIGDDHK